MSPVPPVPLVSALSFGAVVALFAVVAGLAYVVLDDILGAGRAEDDFVEEYVEGPGGRGTRGRTRERDQPTPVEETEGPPGGPWWRRLGYVTLIGWLALLGWPLPVATLDVVLSVDAGALTAPTLLWLVALALVASLVRFVLVPLFLWKDVTVVRRAGGDWTPSQLFYVGAGAVLGTLVCSYYLYKRHQRFGEPALPARLAAAVAYRGPVRSNWWYLIAFDLLLVSGPVTAGLGAIEWAAGRLPEPAALPLYNLGLLLAVGVLLAALLLPVAFWKDARAVRAADLSWSPHPALLAVGGVALFPLVGPYYLLRRVLIVSRGRRGGPDQSQTMR